MADDPPQQASERPGSSHPLRGRTLGGRLILFATLVTLVTVALSLLALSIVLRRQTRSNLVDLLAQNQANARDLQERSLRELLWMSTLVSESPTLRAALDTYRSESSSGAAHRTDLLETVAVELGRTRALVGKDLAIVTDEQGAILAADPPAAPHAGAGESLADRAWIRAVLDSGGQDLRPAFGVMQWSGASMHV